MELINFSRNSVSTKEELRELIGEPHELVIKKSVSILDDQCKRFISMSPLLFLSTSDAEGKCDVSPRGDQAGSVIILNKHQLVIPDRPGNKRQDSNLNILSNPHVGLIFIIPGLEEVLRINGRAMLIKDKEILNKMALKGNIPLLGIGVDVEECFVHCSRPLKESNIWKPETWQTPETLPSASEIFHAHLKINGVELKKES
ncbi:pyridoxine 5'-phosphate oxidase-like protein [Clostridium aceticum]|uniref:Pyridoxine 5'-phosphate oxidase-like protein n=1 Tax=Clostridium aceticum TaxID=84022 RepID=A0A0D8IAG9_9CLOT|nr:MSMEG_1061 family FMN-dependent PPOX-type flavoprotein [Clostridium aceticum]AKL96025.1 pyridoxine 5'-phosphate oxidase-like protein [Clostridium aceticum]KJF27039.1 phosphohydrolase [Clostridium aceticum]